MKIEKLLIGLYIFIFIAYLIKSYFMLDPDFGWHLKMGEQILSNGIPPTDPFSYTMPSFPFVDHEWLTDVFIFISYQSAGWVFLSLIFSLFFVLAIIIPLRFKINFYSIVPILLSTSSLFIFVGIRPHAMSLLFFSILITLLLERKLFDRFKYFIPFIFLLWANLHGGFAMGLAVFFLFLVTDLITTRKISYKDWFLLALSFVITLVNPYTWKLWEEIWRSMSDSSLRFAIVEWMPSFFTFYPVLYLYIALSGILILKLRKSFTFFEKTLYVFLLLAGISSIRHMTFWIIFALPLTFKGIMVFEKQASQIKFGSKRFRKAYIFFILLTIIFVLAPFIKKSFSETFLMEERNYPKKAVSYLRQNPHPGQLFTPYNWGGYLIWKYPEKRVFIDGRMPSWKNDSGPSRESRYAFEEYVNLVSGKADFEKVAEKYGIDRVLLPKNQKERKSFISELDQLIASKIFKKTRSKNIYSELQKNGWEIIYKDDISVIYKKPEID